MSSVEHSDNQSTDAIAPRDADSIRSRFVQLANAASDAGADDLQQLAGTLVDLTAIAESSLTKTSENELPVQMLKFCSDTLPEVEESLINYPASSQQIQERLTELEQHWGEYLELLTDDERFSNATVDEWTKGQENWGDEPAHEESPLPQNQFSVAEMTKLLAGLEQHDSANIVADQAPPQVSFHSTNQENDGPLVKPEIIQETIDDAELIPAYVDDAQQCLAGMEMCLLEIDSNPSATEPLLKFCRELHTLKGASGTVGLNELALYLHGLENSVEAMSKGGQEVKIDPLLEGVDFVRKQLLKLAPDAEAAPAGPVRATPKKTREVNSEVHVEAVAETYVRIEASRLDRLMDLLAELVMLRNRRETYVTALQRLDHETHSCATRLRLVDTFALDRALDSETERLALSDQTHQEDHITGNHLTAALTEMAKDVSEVGRQLKNICDPLSQDNSTISHLIGSFRSELMELRRQPIAGLFRRLYRVARDASKQENRAVELHFEGQGTRAERALQERLYEPLLHIIRNAVSHGIENSSDRAQRGKPPVGQITLNAHADATSLYIEVRDDGRGLNEQALEKKGRELGLIAPGSTPTKKQLWELILQPRFSTKEEVSSISGRGVGMDVVASQVLAMRGHVSIDSVAGEYTSIRLEIPLRSTIEHAMIVRCGQQLLALPMHSVFGAQADEASTAAQSVIGLHELLGVEGSRTAQRVVTLRNRNPQNEGDAPNTRSSENLSIGVDAVVGVEEVVVRTLPPLLRNHECFSGVTLSGEAETVLVLDVPRLADFARNMQLKSVENHQQDHDKRQTVRPQSRKRSRRSQKQRLLIVDDSMTVRKSLMRKIEKHGFESVEAADGKQALELLRDGSFDGIVSDIDMPKMNGIEFIKEVRRLEHLTDIPVVVLTSRRDSASMDAVAALNVRRTFTKPVSDSIVKSIVQSLRFSHPATR